MTQEQRRTFLILSLIKEEPNYPKITIPADEEGQRTLLRTLLNIRLPKPASKEFLEVQDAYLKEETRRKGITFLKDLTPIQEGIYLWKGDITTLECDAIVNAANSGLLGCFYPNHGCIDNAIHTFAGVELRNECDELMKRQGHKEEIGKAKITKAYNLPCHSILHTVGPFIARKPTERDKELLSSCYLSCLRLAKEKRIQSLAFPCISTGEFHFPNEEAAKIAIKTVRTYRKEGNADISVVFNVYKEFDYEIYKRLLAVD